MEKKKQRHKKIIGSIIFYIMSACLVFFIAVNFIVPDKAVNIIGFQVSVVPSGSMIPVINVGDMIIMTNVDQDDIQVDDIVVYYNYIDPDNDGVYTRERLVHRVIEVTDEGSKTVLVTKGDNNSSIDIIRNSDLTIGELTSDDVLAQVPQIGQNNWALRIPYIGYVVLFLQYIFRLLFANPILLLLVIANIGIIIALIFVLRKGNKEKQNTDKKEEIKRIKANDITSSEEHERDDDEEDGSA